MMKNGHPPETSQTLKGNQFERLVVWEKESVDSALFITNNNKRPIKQSNEKKKGNEKERV